MSRPILSLLLALGMASCGHQSATVGRQGSSGVLTRDEIASSHADNAFDVVQRLRPSYLRPRPSGMGGSPFAVVFIDGVRRGAPEILRSVASNLVHEIRFLSASQATTRYGLDLEGGVIDVTLIGR